MTFKANDTHHTVTRCCKGDASSQWEKANLPSHHTHTLNRQSPNIAHVITSTISPHKPHLVKIAPVVTSPHIAKFTTHFFLYFFFLCTQNLSTDLSPCRIWCILALKYDIWWQQYYFNDLREYQLTKFW